MNIKLPNFLFLAVFIGISNALFGQKIQIDLGPDEISENQAWTITITVTNDRLKNYDNFPDIEGFRKRGTSTQSQTSIVNGQISSSQSESDEVCETSYKDRGGKYQGQRGVTLPKA